jgi:hypothetical protein
MWNKYNFYSQKKIYCNVQYNNFFTQHLIQNELVLAMIELKNCWVGIKKTIITHWLTQMLVNLNIEELLALVMKEINWPSFWE